MKSFNRPVLIAVLIGIAVSIGLAINAQQSHNSRIFIEFKNDVNNLISHFESELKSNMEILYGLKGLYDSSDKISREEFKTYVTSVFKRHGDIQALEWIPHVVDAEREYYESLARREGLEHFEITERHDQGVMVRAAKRESYYPVYYLEPFKGNEAALGFDLGSSPARFFAIQASRDSDSLIASEGITLVQEKGRQKGFLLFLPVYKGKPESVDERRQYLLGFALGVFRISDIFKSATEKVHTKGLGIDLKLFDDSAPKENSLLHHHATRTEEQIVSGWQYERKLRNVGGRLWRVVANPTPVYLDKYKSWQPIAILIVGLLFTLLLTAYLSFLTKRTEYVKNLVDLRTADLKASEARITSIVDTAVTGIISIDSRGIVQYFNPAAEKIFGYDAEEVIGQNVNILMPEPFRTEHDQYLKNYLNTGNAKIIGIGREVFGRRRDGSTFPLDLAVSEIKLEDERMFTGILSDITDRKNTENALQEAKSAAEEATRAKSEFLASMSHEIRTPMNAIIGMADLLFETELTKEQEKYITTYRNAGENLLSIINDILDVSKIEAGHLELESTGFGIHKVMDHTREIMAFRAKDKNLEILLDVAQDVPQRIIGDPLRLQQVIINLVGNAIKFTEKGEIVVSVKSHNLEGKNAELMFSVKDSGIGIPKERQDAIFEKFSQADSSTTREFGGTGLGLSISKRLVELMGGSIYVDSETGKGSTFYFTAKFDVDTGYKEETDHLSKDSKVQAGVSVSERPLNILLVEDNDDNRNLIIAYLKKSPHHIETAENGEIAVHKFISGQYDIVLMDVEMPVMDGYTATRNIREWEKKNDAKPTPIVALTAHALKEHEEKSKEAGCNGHVTKPIKKTKLLETIVEYTRE